MGGSSFDTQLGSSVAGIRKGANLGLGWRNRKGTVWIIAQSIRAA